MPLGFGVSTENISLCSHSNAFLSLFLPVKLMQCFLPGVGFLPVTPFLEFSFAVFLYHTLFYQFAFYHTPAVSVRNTQRHTTVHHSNLVLSGGILAFVWTRHLLFNWSHNVQFYGMYFNICIINKTLLIVMKIYLKIIKIWFQLLEWNTVNLSWYSNIHYIAKSIRSPAFIHIWTWRTSHS